MYDVRVIGLYPLTEVESFPGLGKKVTTPVFHGHSPVFITKLKICKSRICNRVLNT